MVALVHSVGGEPESLTQAVGELLTHQWLCDVVVALMTLWAAPDGVLPRMLISTSMDFAARVNEFSWLVLGPSSRGWG